MVAPLTVAQFLSAKLASSGKSRSELADEIGYGHVPNMISMIKSGAARLPLNKVKPVALALDIDPEFLITLVLAEYEPESWQLIVPMLRPTTKPLTGVGAALD